MKSKQVDISILQTVKNYADSFGVTAAYIYKLVKEGRMELFEIDGVKFVDTMRYATIPVTNRRK
ncbi:hypothetical protein BH11BAC5_BH11BAC5_43110 [soil metagenome]